MASKNAPQQLANAFKLVAIAEHPMVGVVGQYSDELYAAARAVLEAEIAILHPNHGASRIGGEIERRLRLAIKLLDQTASQPGTSTIDQRIWTKIDKGE